MEILRYADLIEVPWKNGGGITRNIAQGQSPTQTLWRISRADVAQDGAFSNFAGLERILTVVSDGSMLLDHPGGTLVARPWQPVQFDGAWDIVSRLEDGPLTDLNLMFDPAVCQGSVTVCRGPVLRSVSPPLSGITAFHVVAGQPELGSEHLNPGDTAFIGGPSALSLAEGDAVLEITLHYLDQSASIKLAIANR